ncbi:hypothetical protein WA538_002888 [Blastocystis sp. DL]
MKASPYAMHVGIIVCIFVVYYDVSLFLHYINIIPSPDDSRKRMVGYDIFDKITYIIIGLVFGILLVPCVYFLGGLLSGVLYTYSSQLNETSHCLQHLIDFSSNLESVHETVAQAANDTRICTMNQSVVSEATSFLQSFESYHMHLSSIQSTLSTTIFPFYCEYNCTSCPFCSRQSTKLNSLVETVDSVLNVYNDSYSLYLALLNSTDETLLSQRRLVAEETATVRKYLDFSKLIWTAKPYGNVLLHSLHIDSSYDVVFFLIPVGLALLSFVCCVYLMVSKLLASHVTSAVSIAGMASLMIPMAFLAGVVICQLLPLSFTSLSHCVTLSKLRQHDIVSPNTTEYNLVDTFLLDQSTLARVPVYRQTIQLRATPLDASNRPAFSAMDQLRSFLEVTLREDVETLVTTQRHRRDQIYSQLRERLLAVVGEKPIYKGTRLAKSRASDVCDPVFDGRGFEYVRETYQAASEELDDQIRNLWVAVCRAQEAYEDLSQWNEWLAQETTFVGRLTVELSEAAARAQKTCPRVSACFTGLGEALEKGMASDCGNGGCEFVENAVNAVAEYNCAVMSPNVGEEGEVERSLRSSSCWRSAWRWSRWSIRPPSSISRSE